MTRTARQPVRAEDPSQREPVRKKVRTRKGAMTDQYHIPPEMIPPDIDLQWNVDSVLGQPNPHARSQMARQGWEPVTADMWSGLFDGMFMPKGHKGEINVGGLVLEWRPLELTQEARAEEFQAARQARGIEERKIASGAVDGVDPGFMNTDNAKARANTFLRKEHGRVPSMPIPS